MKKKIVNGILPTLVAINFVLLLSPQFSCNPLSLAQEYPYDTLMTNQGAQDLSLEIVFKRGKAHNYPLMAVWTTDTTDNYLETLYVAKSIAKGVFEHGVKSQGKWMPGPIRRPAALPVWSHSRGVKESDGLYIPTVNTPLPDAITGATPENNFVLKTKVAVGTPEQFYLYFEINQTWDWNEHWTNNKFPDDDEYKTSCQPALVYRALIDKTLSGQTKNLQLIGHSHYSGKDSKIYPTLETITTAKDITREIQVKY